MVMADVYHDQQWVPFDRRAKSTTNAALLLLMGTPAGFFGTLHRKSGRQFAITPRDLPAAADPEAVVHDRQIVCPMRPEADIPISGSRSYPAYDRSWVDS
jgi:hypothetical protein